MHAHAGHGSSVGDVTATDRHDVSDTSMPLAFMSNYVTAGANLRSSSTSVSTSLVVDGHIVHW